jgi:colicin import membrane protein
MSSTMRPPIAPVGWSIALHAVLAALLIFGLSLPKRDEQPVILPIDAVVVDDAVLQAAGRKREDEQRVQDEARERAAAEAERSGWSRSALSKNRRSSGPKNRRESRRSRRRRPKPRPKAKAEAKSEADAKRKADEKAATEKKRAAQEKRDRDSRESDLRAKLAEEETRTSAGFQSLKASYVRAIQVHVEQRWYEPPGVAAGLSCTIYVTQIPGGEVTGMRFGTCNGNAAVRQSIETAVRNASPLPAPPEPSLFEREVELVFTP